jgi:(3R)-3-hydroxyacyl-CoA dehydrogenase / 3a,7a,12a-trihydroxy-5b-cholest-24-enoyl-CoA hydratase / enoyl-CoA hydratase 2
MSELKFDGRVALVTGAGNGLGRSHALALAARGARVVVNDLGGSHTGSGKSSEAADRVVQEIKDAGGQAIANYDSVEDGAAIVKSALDAFGRIDIVINNAGILRDTSFAKMTDADWDLIYRVHVQGAYRVTKAAWETMREQGFGRVILTSSAAGLYGNFGQANYSMAKLGLVGFGKTLALEGAKRNVRTNIIAPLAGSRMTETVLPPEMLDALRPEYVTPLVLWLAHETCEENGGTFEVGGGFMGKLRWERAEGKTFKLGRAITPEQVQRAWPQVCGFEKTTHPTDVASAMAPIVTNLGSFAKCGNDFIDVDAALGYEFPEATSKYDERDVALYALGIGAGRNALDPKELQFVYEMGSFQVLPTFGVVPALQMVFDMYKQGKQAPGMNYGFERVLHGEQYLELAGPLPTHATLTHKAKIRDIFDKGKNAVVVTEIRSFDEQGEQVALNELVTVVRGGGGWGGERGPENKPVAQPTRAADKVTEERVREDQALLYRLSGDINPLHADPGFAKDFGFDKPILHGLCTYGIAARHVLAAYAGNDARLFKSMRARFSETVFPGDTLVTEMWKESDQKILFQVRAKERDKLVLAGAVIELFAEVPKRKPKAATAQTASAPSAASGTPTVGTDAIFAVIADYVSKNPDLVASIGVSYQWHIQEPDSSWVLDLKSGKGSVAAGTLPSPDCTLTIRESDFLDMTSGKADPQKLFFEKKLQIGGNIMASQKLAFLKKIDVSAAKTVKAAPVPSTAASAPVKAPAVPTVVHTPAVRTALEQALAKVKAGKGSVEVRVANPSASFVVSLETRKVLDTGAACDAVIALEDSAWPELAKGLRSAYQRGLVRIDGNVSVVTQLGELGSFGGAA